MANKNDEQLFNPNPVTEPRSIREPGPLRAAPPRKYPNSTYNTSLTVAANAAAQIIPAAGNAIVSSIQKDIEHQTQVDMKQLHDTALGVSESGEPVPDGMIKADATLQKIKASHKAGNISRTMMDMAAERLMRGIENKYPGFSGYAQQMAVKFYGSNPRQALLKAKFAAQNAGQAASTAEQKRRNSWLSKNDKYMGAYFPTYHDEDAATQDRMFQQAQGVVSRAKGAEHMSAQITLKAQQETTVGGVTRDTAKRGILSRVVVQRGIAEQGGSAGILDDRGFGEFLNNLRGPDSPGGTEVTSEEQKQAIAAIPQYRQQRLQLLYDAGNHPSGGSNNQTWREAAGPEAWDALVQAEITRANDWGKRISEGRYAELRSREVLASSVVTDVIRQNQIENEEIVSVQAATKMGLDKWIPFMSEGPKVSKGLGEIVGRTLLGKYLGESNAPPPPAKAAMDLQAPELSTEGKRANASRMTEALFGTITDKDSSPESKARAITSLYSPDNEGFIQATTKVGAKKAQRALAAQLTDPLVLAEIVKLSKSKPQLLQWTVNQLESSSAFLLKSDAQELDAVSNPEFTDGYKITIDPKTSLIDIHTNSDGVKTRPYFWVVDSYTKDINQAVMSLTGAYKALGMDDEQAQARVAQFMMSPNGLQLKSQESNTVGGKIRGYFAEVAKHISTVEEERIRLEKERTQGNFPSPGGE